MKEVTETEFTEMLADTAIFSSLHIKAENSTITISKFASDWITFSCCTFDCYNLDFLNLNRPELRVEFKKCSFKCSIKIINCIVDQFTFCDTQSLKALNVEKGLMNTNKLEMKYFEFSNSCNIEPPLINTDFSFINCFFEKFEFKNIKHISGKFRLTGSTIGNKINAVSHIIFDGSQLFNAYISSNTFEQFLSFNNSSFVYEEALDKSKIKGSKFYNNTFYKVNFSNSDFIGKMLFDQCDFESTTWFEDCKNIKNSQLEFIACKFLGYVLFDNSAINNLIIQHTTFERKVSFFQLTVNSIKLHQLTFNRVAYFDELKIGHVENKKYLKSSSNFTIVEWKHTLRIIKMELQRTENKIDFNRFRNYELATHYKELKFKKNFKDTFILWATRWSTNFGSWVWAFWFTIIMGLFFYSLLYFIEFKIALNLNNDNNYILGAFRFFLVTDFYSPFLERQYLNNGISWTIFVMGKIFIAFGIYEMIQAFRKFKA